MQKSLFPVLLAVVAFYSCNLTRSAQPEPTYIHIDSFSFSPSSVSGVTTHEITSVWAYYNNNPIGTFDLPATIPVIANGSGVLELSPGITIDGLNALTGAYPFYQIDTFSFTAQPGKIINHEAHTQFYDDVVIKTIADFTISNEFYLWKQGGQVPITRPLVDSETEGGNNGQLGSIYITAAGDSSVDSSALAFPIPSGSAFIELDYTCDMSFSIGLQANIVGGISASPFYFVGVFPSGQWQKMYVNVADFAAQYKAESYNLYIKAVLPPGQAAGRVLLDNIQLVAY